MMDPGVGLVAGMMDPGMVDPGVGLVAGMVQMLRFKLSQESTGFFSHYRLMFPRAFDDIAHIVHPFSDRFGIPSGLIGEVLVV